MSWRKLDTEKFLKITSFIAEPDLNDQIVHTAKVAIIICGGI